MCRNDNAVRVGVFRQQVGYQHGMSEGIRVFNCHLDDVAGLYLRQFNLMPIRSRSHIGGKKVPEVGHTGPGWRTVIQ